ncbi:serine/threonine protein kinase [Geodermatophilus telluris]|uniref:non-specific serine/threonine protein kinase n=1 Tax=Geodermatophilus telluris TaxID=1190417 RepID=A0A1G6U8S1_9ACTN|nr:serine/threonine-protein kinase [Geodermatophilus telluris]SDD36987.1 serine/threonine protein kinase [Geodermatophilus telluris]
MALSTGTVLAGRYEITEPIATGGMGEVWRARDRVLDRVVAAKVLRSEFTGDPSFVARFRNEARHTAALSHPNIASVYDYGETDDERGHQLAFLVMELVEGKPLVTILHEEGRLPVDWTLHVLGQAADGLSAAHAAGVVHRDIKPGNLIVRPDGVVKLTDFGIARTRDATPLTRTGMVVGTAQYLSPEQAQGMEVTAASDVYSLGVVGYECLTGGRPFDGTSQVAIALAHINRPPPPLPAEIPVRVRQLIERALAKDPADRFTDGADFAAAVRTVAAGGPAPVPPATGLAAAATTEVIPEVADDGTRVLGAAAGGAVAGAATGAAAAAAGPRTGGRHAAGPRTMPPLQGPPVDDEDGQRWDDEPAARRSGNRRGLWIALGLVLLAGLLTGAFLLLGGGDGDDGGTADPTRSSAPTSAATTPAAAQVAVPAAAELIGEDADDVEADLTDAGLQVSRTEATGAQLAALGRDLDPNDVAGVAPAGTTVAAGTVVTLTVAVDGYTVEEEDSGDDGGAPEPTEDGDQGDDGGGTTPAPAPATTTPAPQPTTTAPQPTTQAPTTVPTPTSQAGTSAPPPTTTAPAEGDGNAGQGPFGPQSPGVQGADEGRPA